MTANTSNKFQRSTPCHGITKVGGPELRAVLLLFGLLAPLWLAPPALGDWSFAILGDTRGTKSTTTGVSPYLNTVATKIASLQPDLVLFSGNLCNGNDTNGLTGLTYTQQYANWKAAMSPITTLGIPIYPIRGNHENNCSEGIPLPDLKQAYYDAIAAFLPTNGPNNGTNDDQRGFTYSVTHNNATFIMLDQYFYYDLTSQTGYHSIDQNWLNQQLQQANTPYTVVVAHEPVFMTTGENAAEHFFGTDSAGFARLQTFWDSLGTNGAQLYACGHVHNLSVALTRDDANDPIYQLISGNGGAPLDTNMGDSDPGVEVFYTNDTCYGFALATVGGSSMTIEYYLLNGSTWSMAPYTTTILPNAQAAIEAAQAGGGSTFGDWRILDHPDSVQTTPRAVSGKMVVGVYYPTASEEHGFVYNGTTWTNLDYPGAWFTEPLGISGPKIVGDYTADPVAQVWHSFVYDGRTWTKLDYPGAVATHACGIQGNTIVGWYFDGANDYAFEYNGRTWTTLEPLEAEELFANAISGRNIAGSYLGSDGEFHGFIYNGTTCASLDASHAVNTHCWGVSGEQVVGNFALTDPGYSQGFLYDAADASWTTLDFPGAEATNPFGTDGQSIVGSFSVSGVTHGFLYATAAKPVPAQGWVVGTTPSDGYGVILHTVNGGHDWERQGTAAEIPNVSLNNVKAVSSQTVWVVGNTDSGYGVILRTQDGGQTWVRQGQAATIPNAVLFGVGAANQMTAWTVGQHGTILKTTDGGKTWTQQTSGTTANLYEVAVVNPQVAWAAGNQDNGYAVVLHTTDGGRTWQRQGTAATLGGQAIIDMTAVDTRTAWVAGTGSLVAKTTDAGASWHAQMATGLDHNNGICAISPYAAWMATDYNLTYRTADGGATWDQRSVTGQVLGNYYLLGVSAPTPTTAWVVGANIPDPQVTQGIILHTMDGGATWYIQPPPVNVPFRRVSFVGARK